MSLEKDLTIKQRKWLKKYIKSGNATQSAMAVYDCKDENSAAVIGFENVRKLNIEELLEEMGLSDSNLINSLKEGIGATRATNAAILLASDGKTVKAEEQGLIEVPDYAMRHKYLETALKLKKRLGNDSQPAVQINTFSPEQLQDEQLDEIIS